MFRIIYFHSLKNIAYWHRGSKLQPFVPFLTVTSLLGEVSQTDTVAIVSWIKVSVGLKVTSKTRKKWKYMYWKCTNLWIYWNNTKGLLGVSFKNTVSICLVSLFASRFIYSKTCVKRPLSKSAKFGFQDQLLLNAGQKYCRMLQGEHSAILSTFIKLPFVIKIFVVSIF